MVIICWLLFSVVVGFIGANRRIGGVGAFFLSLLLSPLIGLIIALLSRSTDDDARDRQMMDLQKQQAATLAAMQPRQIGPKAELSLPLDPDVRANRLKDLRDRGVITQEEFMDQISRL